MTEAEFRERTKGLKLPKLRKFIPASGDSMDQAEYATELTSEQYAAADAVGIHLMLLPLPLEENWYNMFEETPEDFNGSRPS